ncbi:MAG: translocation/assembly module TamB domain-containing protein [Pseudomonadota bacterium]
MRKHAIAVAAGAAVIVGAIGVAIGPGAAWVVEHGADGQRIWRLGLIKVDGVSGPWLGNLRAAHVTLQDDAGVWFDAHDVELKWRPFDLFGGTFSLDEANLRAVSITRRPVLSPERPSAGANYNLNIGNVHVGQINLAQPVFGVAGQFRADFAMNQHGDRLDQLDLNLARTDSNADHAIARYRRGDVFALHVDVEGARDGLIAHLFDVPDDSVRMSADGRGDQTNGQVQFDSAISQIPLAKGAMRWTERDWSLDTDARLDALPMFDALADRVGKTLSVQAHGMRHGQFTAHADTPYLTLDLAGALNDKAALDGPAHIVAEAKRLSDIAHESPLELGPARFEGELRIDHDTTALSGQLDGREVALLGQTGRLTGRVDAALSSASFTLSGDLRAPAQVPELFAQARLQTQLDFNRRTGRFTLSRATLDGASMAATAQGWANRGDGEFAGDWRIRRIETTWSQLSGDVGGRWRAGSAPTPTGARVWSLTLQGDARNVGSRNTIYTQLLGATPKLDATLRFEQGGITVDHARIDGDKLRAGATGRIVHGDDNLRVEASARGPLQIGDVTVAGAVDATGRLTGRFVRPTLQADAQLASLTALGVELAHPLVQFTLAPNGNTYRGHGVAHGAVHDQDAAAESDLVVAGDGTVSLPTLTAHIDGLQASGNASIGPRGANALLALNGKIDSLLPGVTGNAQGTVTLTPEALTASAQVTNADAGDLHVRTASVTASGPYKAINARFDLHGRLNQAPLAFAGTALIENQRTTQLSIQGSGALASVPIATRTPITMNWPRDGLETALDVTVGDGALAGRWSERGRALTGSFSITQAPLAPLGAIWGERATGQIAGRFSVNSGGGGLAGDADVSLIDARFAGRQRGTMSSHIVAHLEPTRLQATVDAHSADGLQAHLEADAPVETSAAPLRIALTPERRGTARWTVSGPVEGLWAAARFQDQDLQGNVAGEGQLSFGAGYLAGDGHVELTDGRFEDKISGVKLQQIQARINIGANGVEIDHFTAADSRGGTITATGGSADARQGQIAVQLHDLRLVDRPDAHARASGELNFQWQGLDSSLTGELNLSDADLSVAQRPEAGIPQLDVIEINRPQTDASDDDPPPQQPAMHPTHIDVRVRAPGRVFTRGRGLEAEWSLDLRLDGNSAAPRIYGNAQTVRGTLSLSGQPFDISDGRIDFDGAVENARINLTAERDTADLTAKIQLTGTANDPDITLTSDPALPQDEILPQVLFGHSVADLSALEAAQLAASLAALSGQASFDLVDAARAAAGLDRFNVQQDASGGLLVAGGVYLTRNVYVEIGRTGLGQASTRVEWTLRPKLVLITSFLQNGDQRVSIRWRREGN